MYCKLIFMIFKYFITAAHLKQTWEIAFNAELIAFNAELIFVNLKQTCEITFNTELIFVPPPCFVFYFTPISIFSMMYSTSLLLMYEPPRPRLKETYMQKHCQAYRQTENAKDVTRPFRLSTTIFIAFVSHWQCSHHHRRRQAQTGTDRRR